MKVLLWSLVTIAGLIFGLGELAYARYFAGETIGEAILFENGAPQTHQIEIAKADLPVRLNLRMWGARETIDIAFFSKVTLATGGQSPGDTIAFQAVIDEESDLASLTRESGNFTLRPVEVPNLAQSTQLFDAATPGTWALTASVSGENGFRMTRIKATIKRNARAVNWQFAGPGLAMLIFGLIMLIGALRKRFPHLAS